MARLKRFEAGGVEKVKGVLHATQVSKGWHIKADAVVGVLDLGSVRLTINPKVAFTGEQVITWLSYATGAHPHAYHEGRKPQLLSATGYDAADLIVEALIGECRKLLRNGLRREYVRERSAASHARGRLDIAAQATREYGQIGRFHVSDFRQTVATWENEICALALSRAARHAKDASLAQAAASLVERFPMPDNELRAIAQLRKASYTRLNLRYRPAHAWAGVLLNTGGIADLLCQDGFLGRTLLLDMDDMWERAVQRMAVEAAVSLRGGGVPNNDDGLAIRVYGDVQTTKGAKPNPFRPDRVVRVGDGPRAFRVPVDAKYYAYDHSRISSENVHQLMTYVAGYCDDDHLDVLLVYPSAAGGALRTLVVRNAHTLIGRIRAIAIDAGAGPEAGTRKIREVLQRLSSAAPR